MHLAGIVISILLASKPAVDRASDHDRSPIRASGGTDARGEAVAAGLKWLLARQAADGGWDFDRKPAGIGNEAKSRTEATGLALLSFLSVGQTIEQGRDGEPLRRAVEFLRTQGKPASAGIDLQGQGGTMLSHAIAATAVCELYGMLKQPNPQLKELAQAAIDFSRATQKPSGGWSYYPGKPVDLRVTGWQIMALYSGYRAGLIVPERLFVGADKFLDRVYDNTRKSYGFTEPDADSVATAIGLLSRVYLGRRLTDPALRRQVEGIETHALAVDAEYNFFAANLVNQLRQGKRSSWQELRDREIAKAQVRKPPETGSWADYKVGDVRHDRLEATAFSLMTLGVWYRYRPLFYLRDSQPQVMTDPDLPRIEPRSLFDQPETP